MTTWVAPQQGCAYCHNVENLADDSVYAKKVARRMIQMTRHINQDWNPHVQTTGVICYTCHRGEPVPTNVWYEIRAVHTQAGSPKRTTASVTRTQPTDRPTFLWIPIRHT